MTKQYHSDILVISDITYMQIVFHCRYTYNVFIIATG